MSEALNGLLSQHIVNKQVSHAYLLAGEVAWEQARCFAMALQCLSPAPDGASCGDCISCRKILHDNHPDVQVVAPERNYLRIEQLRKMQSKAHFEKYEGRYKIFIIRDSDMMKAEAANSLLKLLEEPPEHTVVILLSADADKLLPTILSRCQTVLTGQAGFSALSKEAVEALLPRAEAFLQTLPSRQLYQVLAMTNELEKDRDAALHFTAACLRVLHFSLTGWFGREAGFALNYAPQQLLRAAKAAEEALDMIRKNINLKLLLDILFLKLWSYLKQAN